MSKILVYYFIQNDQWESIKEPNVFALEKKYANVNDVKVQDIYESFPIKLQNFYHRFFNDNSKMGIKGWIDLPPSAKAPVQNEKIIYVKSLRLPEGINILFKNNSVYEKQKETRKSQQEQRTVSPSPINNATNFNSIPSRQPGSIQNNLKVEKKEASIPKVNSSNNFQNLIDMGGESNERTESAFDNIDIGKIKFHEDIKEQPKETVTNNGFKDIFNDLGGMFPNQNQTQSQPQAQPQTNKAPINLMHGLEGLDFGVGTNFNPPQPENVQQNNNQEKKGDQIFNLPTLDSFITLDQFTIRELCDPIILRWQNDGADRKNIRMLLATLHEIFTDERWTPVTLGDVLDDKMVRKVYNKAALVIHPDKVHSSDPRMKYCAERIFNILTESYNEFRK